MNPVYFETRFRVIERVRDWPAEFAIISAFATTGEEWTAPQNALADEQLRLELRRRGGWFVHLIGFSPTTGHAEPSWAVAMPLAEACDLGRRFHQDAIYYVHEGETSVTHCDERRALVHVGLFSERLHADP